MRTNAARLSDIHRLAWWLLQGSIIVVCLLPLAAFYTQRL